MKNKLLRNVLIILCSFILITLGIVLGLGYHYTRTFTISTWVNHVYCTGKTPEEVNQELLQDAEAPFLEISDGEGSLFSLSPESVGMTLSYMNGLEELLQSQGRTVMVEEIGNAVEAMSRPVTEGGYEIRPEISVDPDLLQEALCELPFVKEEAARPGELAIVYDEEAGYILSDGLKNRLDQQALADYVLECIDRGEYQICLEDADIYRDLPCEEADLAVLDQWQALQEYISCGIVYDMGAEQIVLAGKIASDFIGRTEEGEISFDSDGQPIIDEAKIEAFIDELAESYDTYGKELTFTATSGETKTVPYVNYGTQLDTAKEKKYLKDAFLSKVTEVHTPSYIHQGYARGLNDIGDTYIEVDMGNQKLYAYLEGELLVETDIVTGNVKRKMSTPEGVVHIYNKQKNRTLRGPGYASFVKYWMPVKGGVGLHDASWRDEFGGEIYKTGGSHGCINIPSDVMPEIYENFEIGVPVILFY